MTTSSPSKSMVTSSSSGSAASTGSGGGHGDAGFSVDAGGGGDAGGVADAGIDGGGDAGGNTDGGGGGVDADGGGGGGTVVDAGAGIEARVSSGVGAVAGGSALADLAAAESNSFRSVLRTGVVASGGLRVDVGAGDEFGVLACGGTGGDVPVLTEIGVGAADAVAVVGCGRAGDAFPLLARPESISFRSVLSTGVVSSLGGLRVDVDVDVDVDAGGELGGIAGDAARSGVCDLTDHDVGVAAGDDVDACVGAGAELPVFAGGESSGCVRLALTSTGGPPAGLRFDGRAVVSAGLRPAADTGEELISVGVGVPDLTATESAGVALGETADVGGRAGAGGELAIFAAGGESSGCVRLAITSTGDPSAELRFDGRAVVSAGLRPAADAGELTVVAGAGVPGLTATETAGVAVGETVDVVGCTGAGGAVPVLAEAEAESGGGVADEIEVFASVGTGGELPFLAGTESGAGARVGGAVTGGPSAELRLEVDTRAEVEVVRGGVAVLTSTESGVVVVGATVDVVGCSETDRGLSFLGGMSSGARAGVTAAGGASVGLRIVVGAGIGGVGVLTNAESGVAVGEIADVVDCGGTARGSSAFAGMGSGPGVRAGVTAAGSRSD